MSATDVTTPAPAQTPAAPRRRSSLLAAEVLRLSRRRMIHILLVLAAVGFLVVAGISTTQFGEPSAAEIEQATELARQIDTDNAEFYQQCVDDLPEGEDAESYCGTTESDPSLYLDTQPFTTDLAIIGAGATALGAAAVLFLVGATSIGADWSSRALIASLFWEPRRLRVLGVRAVVVVGLAVLVGVLAQAAWAAVALFLVSSSGQDLGEEFWSEMLGAQARSVLLGALVALLGFAAANLVRGTGAALGIGFFYIAIVENVVRFVWGPGEQWLLTTNAVALVNPGGTTVRWTEDDSSAEYGERLVEVVIDNLQGGVVVAVYVAVVLAVGTALFRLRDLH